MHEILHVSVRCVRYKVESRCKYRREAKRGEALQHTEAKLACSIVRTYLAIPHLACKHRSCIGWGSC